jgi:Uma2 family endonuclease
MNDVTLTLPQGEIPARFTIDEFMELLSSNVFAGGEKLELVDGVIVRMSPAQSTHALLQRQIFLALNTIFPERASAEYVAYFELTLPFGQATLRDADVAVAKPFDTSVRFADPATVLLIVEIAHTTLEKDLNSKRLEYARAGIPHYWVVDANGQRVHVMSTIANDDYAVRDLVQFGEPIPVPTTDQTISVGDPAEVVRDS